MRTISTGEPATLGTYRKIALVLGGKDSETVKFFDDYIRDSPNGENEEVIAHETQVIHLILSMVKKGGEK